MSQSVRPRPRGFTLIELLVVIAVVALLVGILLPALRKARMAGWMAVSLSNVRSIAQAGAIYQSDQRGYLPLTPSGVPVPTTINEVFPWSGWGKNCSEKWRVHSLHDCPAAVRPLNPYLYSDRIPDRRTDSASRTTWQLPVCKDPSDRIGHQWEWNNSNSSTFQAVKENSDGTSCYDDVGTSYLWQVKWFENAIRQTPGGSWTKAFRLGAERFRFADSYVPSRMIWLNDEWCDITINQFNANAKIKNGYGDINKGVCGFLDGHSKYTVLIPGGESSPYAITQPWRVPGYNNGEYTVVFPDLRR